MSAQERGKLASSLPGQGQGQAAAQGPGVPTPLYGAAWPPAYDHVFQGVFGQPAVEKHGDEQIPQWGPEYLQRRWVRGLGAQQPPAQPAAHPP